MELVQKTNQEYIKRLKEWQAEAFLYVVLSCCLESYSGRYNLSKICALYDQTGDIFEWDLVKNTGAQVQSLAGADWERKKQFKTNIRLLPKECHDELFNMCSIILEKYNKPLDKEKLGILIEELS